MNYGFVKVISCAPQLKLADCKYNAEAIIQSAKNAAAKGAALIVFSELGISGASCGALFTQKRLLDNAFAALCEIAKATKGLNSAIVVGAPLYFYGNIYNCAAVLCGGEIIGIVPTQKSSGVFSAGGEGKILSIGGKAVPFDSDLVFRCADMPELAFGIEIGEEKKINAPLIVHLCAKGETVMKDSMRRAKTIARSENRGFIYNCAGRGESTTDYVCCGAQLIAENGVILTESKPFGAQYAESELDMQYLSSLCKIGGTAKEATFSLKKAQTSLSRIIEKDPFAPSYASKDELCAKALEIQAQGLAARVRCTYSKGLVIGISGGLDSTLALLVAVRAMELCGMTSANIQALTMPCFGTSNRTRGNAEKLCEALNVPLKCINITAAVNQHFADIEHGGAPDAAFENSQARERTQILMDIANMQNALVVGTGDLSELALGWATYNGDHMSSYAVNGDIPKTFVRHIVEYYAKNTADEALREVLRDIVATPVSPELLPISGNESDQRTEDIVGPYELHDFFIWNIAKCGFTPEKVKYLAEYAFKGQYDRATIEKWLGIFCRRFITQQFKRSCCPDGPAVFDFSLSPRAGYNFPSDASPDMWK
ncbi:MAG: NAD(+) synthase [Clostridia bacterium]|nr:NAD(+) synthase [Clostridia bacterium]